MNRILFRFVIVVLFSVHSTFLMAQDVQKDACLWLRFQAEKSLSDRVTGLLTAQYSLKENLLLTDRFFVRAGVSIKLSRTFNLQANYTAYRDLGSDLLYSTGHRISGGLLTEFEQGLWNLQWRNLVQLNWKDVYSSENGRIPELVRFRTRVQLTRTFTRRIRMFVAEELYFPLNQSFGSIPNVYRTSVGMKYKINRKVAVEPSFILKSEEEDIPLQKYIWRLTWYVKL